MSDIMKLLLNLRSLRATCREYSLDQLNDALGKLNTVVNEREEEEVQQYNAEKEKREKLEAYRQMLIEDGIAPEELIASLATGKIVKKKRDPRPAKYRYTDESGEEKTWTGQGRTPKFLQDKNLEDFAI
ncbi:H-NS family nucleoid-associated regulatory protein [Photobacterium indicum]|uniref:H-NS family histone-like protein n=1 Tax=Photobacterium indicum TaxID=81447 RepID=UPI003D1271B0